MALAILLCNIQDFVALSTVRLMHLCWFWLDAVTDNLAPCFDGGCLLHVILPFSVWKIELQVVDACFWMQCICFCNLTEVSLIYCQILWFPVIWCSITLLLVEVAYLLSCKCNLPLWLDIFMLHTRGCSCNGTFWIPQSFTSIAWNAWCKF